MVILIAYVLIFFNQVFLVIVQKKELLELSKLNMTYPLFNSMVWNKKRLFDFCHVVMIMASPLCSKIKKLYSLIYQHAVNNICLYLYYPIEDFRIVFSRLTLLLKYLNRLFLVFPCHFSDMAYSFFHTSLLSMWHYHIFLHEFL